MVQMSFDGLEKVDIDFSDAAVPESVKIVRPLLFRDGDAYCCVLGPDPQRGILGCGYTQNAALTDFDNHLQAFRQNHQPNDEVAVFVESAYASERSTADS